MPLKKKRTSHQAFSDFSSINQRNIANVAQEVDAAIHLSSIDTAVLVNSFCWYDS
jgi:hypothetical protein